MRGQCSTEKRIVESFKMCIRDSLRGIQQLYNAFLPDHPADHRYGTLNVEL